MQIEKKNEDMLKEVIGTQIESISGLPTNSPERTKAIDDLQKLYGIKLESDDRVIKVILGGAEVVLPLIFYGVFVCLGFRFESTGSFGSTIFKNIISHLPRK